MNRIYNFSLLLTSIAISIFLILPQAAIGQASTGSLRGRVVDPAGAVIPQAQITVTSSSGKAYSGKADGSGAYQIPGLAPGSYTVTATSSGFAPYASSVTIAAGQSRALKIAMEIETQQQQVQVEADAPTVDTSPESNANAIILTGKDLDTLSDDPDELEDQLQALAGPAAGPNGGEIYIDGFTGGQLPPKSSIREIRINQNPFSAEFDRLGYGRIEIFTKPGTDKMHGQFEERGNYSAFNSQNPILNANLQPGQTAIQEPSYDYYSGEGSVGGPLSKTASYYLSIYTRNTQNVSVIDAINPASDFATNPNGTTLNEAYPNHSSRYDVSPRLDLQLGKSNTLTLRYEFYRSASTNSGVGTLSLPEQAENTQSIENTLQASDSMVLSKNFVDDIRFQYRRFRTQTIPVSDLPQVTVQGSFVDGGSFGGTTRDNQDMYELQNYFSGARGNHSLNFGSRLRAYRVADYTDSETNGAYTFASLANYLAKKPEKYTVAQINNYTARAILFDGSLFYQDDWKVSQGFTFSYGLRWETQNRISDKSDWAPRLSFAYALGHHTSAAPPKTVLRAGYGWFYERFTVPNSFGSLAGAPYVIRAIHNNGINQKLFTITNPTYNQTGSAPPIPPPLTGSTAAPTIYNIDPHFHASNDMQAAVGIDRQLAKRITGNITYLYGRGVHQYYTNNIGAPAFSTAGLNIYPNAPLPAPTENIDQYQSGGVYRQTQLIASGRASYQRFSFFTFFTYNNAKGDTSGISSTPSVAQKPGLDYGRTTFDVHERFLVLGNVLLPYAVSVSPFMAYNAGTPYNVTAGSDLTSNNALNGRPTYAASCSEPNAVQTAQFGCLNTNPFGTNEKIIPYGLGTGPSNVSLNMRISKVIGIGPKVAEGTGARSGDHHDHGSGGGLGAGLSGNHSGPSHLYAAPSRKYNLTLTAYGTNIFNHENLGTPNGTLSPRDVGGVTVPQQFFGKSQTLASSFFSSSSAGNRTIFLQAVFSF